MKLKIKKLHEAARVPTYGSDGAACFDIYAIESETVHAREAHTFRTGLAFEVPEGYVMQVYSRSGHGFKHEIRLANCVGIIDADYRGELYVRLTNDSSIHFDVEPGDRIAQAMLVPIERCVFEQADDLQETLRGNGGLGSTGR